MRKTAASRTPRELAGDVSGEGAAGTRPLADVQSVCDDDMRVYETVCALNVDRRTATVADVARLADLPEEFVRHSLDVLVADGWLLRRRGGYVVGPHDWGLEY
ncbi:hypothetical protein [Microtetraspora sp. NBRC 16547]|uniref:hypothetical protein n=1 Tax=Microtetraspora sp. NBRC 16547 TaxID=3030993 RepID=UPI0024A5D7DA|nr:hypothetical protein [Microtetraspora sp. NBRC 16547]GLX00152.1 hypothetical protein Misp02_42380 [Microtetraspora sp. NBRC 16547]